MRIGISSYTYTWAVGVPGEMPRKPLSCFDLINLAQQHGVEVLQIADNYPLIGQTEYQWRELGDFATQKNICIEIGGRGLMPENLMKHIEMAAIFKSPILRMVIDADGFEPGPKEAVAIIRNALPMLEKKEITLALENHDRLYSSVFKQIIETLGHPLAGICLDSVNSMGIGEGLESVVGNLAPFTVNLHVKDFTVRRVDHKMGFVVEGTPAGDGMLRLPWILEMIKPYGKCSSAILELWTSPDQHLDATIAKENRWAKESIKYLKTVIK